jgi:Domain of unknown function (DUF4062)
LRRNDLDVFISSKQEEFNRKRKRLEKIVNSMPYLSCELMEKRGADTDNTTVRSVKAAKECDFYIGIFGKQYSLITQKECKIALDNNKRCLIYVLNVNEEKIDPHVRDFIKKELKHRISYYKFSSCKQLEEQIRKDLGTQMIQILRTGLQQMAKTKKEVKNKEQEFKDNVYLSSSPSDKNTVLSLLQRAKLDLRNKKYLNALINTSAYVEILLRRNLTESNHKDYSKVPFHILLRESIEQKLLSTNMQTRLKVFWNTRNRALHYGSTPSENDVKALIELANIMEKTFVHRLESSPILTERDRQIIATRFMQRLCDLDSHAISLAQSREFTIDEIWDGYLGGYNKEIVAPFVIFYFENELGYLRQLTNKKVIITSKGRNHCGEEFVLPSGL